MLSELSCTLITRYILHVKLFSDNVKDSEMCTAVIEAFTKKLKPSLDRETCGLSLRKLQFSLCKEQYEKKHKSFETKSSWLSSFSKKGIWLNK